MSLTRPAQKKEVSRMSLFSERARYHFAICSQMVSAPDSSLESYLEELSRLAPPSAELLKRVEQERQARAAAETDLRLRRFLARASARI